jgi:type I restriction enzyme R subunit
MATKLAGKDTFFLPFNQGSNGAGNDGGKGNPANPDGYPTAYLWEQVFQKDSMMDILQKFIHLQVKEDKKLLVDGSEKVTKKKTIIFPRYHQLDVVRKLIADVRENGAGKNYLIQHSAGSGKSNSIAWVAYRLASLHDEMNKAIFSSVIIVTDRVVLDKQLQDIYVPVERLPWEAKIEIPEDIVEEEIMTSSQQRKEVRIKKRTRRKLNKLIKALSD